MCGLCQTYTASELEPKVPRADLAPIVRPESGVPRGGAIHAARHENREAVVDLAINSEWSTYVPRFVTCPPRRLYHRPMRTPLLLALVALDLGCGSTAATGHDGGAVLCTSGQTVACVCVGGGQGAQTCACSGSYGSCQCPDAGGQLGDASGDGGTIMDVVVPDGCLGTTAGDCNGVACTSIAPHTTPTCVACVCVVGPCQYPFADCDHNPANGCEVNISSDPANCGACGAHCTTGLACQGAMCLPCTMNPQGAHDACEGVCTDTQGDPSNCGACGTVCPGTAPTCVMGICH
jgi:hypothetical protein